MKYLFTQLITNKVTLRSYLITLLSLAAFVFTSLKADNEYKEQLLPDIFNTENTGQNMIIVLYSMNIEANFNYTEIDENQKTLKNFLTKIKASTNIKELVIVGNMLEEWFLPTNGDLYNAFIAKDIAQSNKDVIEALDNIIQEQKITVSYVHEKHPKTLSEGIIALRLPGIIQVQNNDFERSSYTSSGYPKIAIGENYSYHYFFVSDPLFSQNIMQNSIPVPK